MMISQEQSISYHTVTLGAMTREGDALAEIVEWDATGEEHVRSLRVPAGLPGEVVTIAVEEPPAPRTGKKRRHWKSRPPRVWIAEMHTASPLRVEASCPIFGTCGGCQLQHMRYDAQLAWKRDVVYQLLRDVGGFDNPPVLPVEPCDIPWHYRNHMRFSVNRSGQPGLTARGTHRVLPLASCPLAHEQINSALSILSQQPNAQPQVLIRCSANSPHMLIQPYPDEDTRQKLAAIGLDVQAETMEEQLGDATYRIRPSSFFQTNTAQAEKMARMVLDGLLAQTATGDQQNLTVVDAYCGVGTFAVLLARHVGKVIAIEESASAIRDAQWNLREVENVEILKGKVEDVLPTLSAQLDGLVIDPPRAGCQSVVLDALMQHPVARVVYVSCDPSTLARDLHILCHSRSAQPIYHLLSVQPLDMFPQTAHIECIATLERIKQVEESA